MIHAILAAILTGLIHSIVDMFLIIPEILKGPLSSWSDALILIFMTVATLALISLFIVGVTGLLILLTHKIAHRYISTLVVAGVILIPLIILNKDLAYSHPLSIGGLLALLFFIFTGTLWFLSIPEINNLHRWISASILFIVAILTYILNLKLYHGLYPSQHMSLSYLSILSTAAGMFILLKKDSWLTNILKDPSILIVLSAIVIVVWILGLFMLPKDLSQRSRSLVFSMDTELSQSITFLRSIVDFDRDGYSPWLDGGDCDDTDPSVHPGAIEIPENKKDDDCIGGDPAVADIAQLSSLLGAYTLESAHKTLRTRSHCLIFLTVDALRHDWATRMKAYKMLKIRGVEFTHAYASHPSTILSFYSILTEKPPSSIRLRRIIKWESPANDKSLTLPQYFSKYGFKSTGVFFHFIFSKQFGITRGFSKLWYISNPQIIVWGAAAKKTFIAATKTLKSLRKQNRPFFLWVHFYDPHEPYIRHKGFDVPETYRGLYTGEVEYTDKYLARFVQELAKGGELDRCVTVMFADHGESLGEHGLYFHDSALYDEQLRVPLIFVGPFIPHDKSINMPVSLMNLASTVTELMGLPAFKYRVNASFASLVMGGSTPTVPVPVFMELVKNGLKDRAVLMNGYKLIHHIKDNTFELYDLNRDPYELLNIYDLLSQEDKYLAHILTTYSALLQSRGISNINGN